MTLKLNYRGRCWARLFTLLWVILPLNAALTFARSRPEPLPVVVVTGADPALADETIEIVKAAHDTMAVASGVQILDTLRVVYVSRSQSFDSIAGGFFPDWGIGVAIADRNLIAIRSPRDHPIGRQLPSILRHELAHLHFDAILGRRRPPRWMHEGYAQQLAHEWVFGDDWLLARAVFSDNLLPLADIDGVNSFRDAKARLAYAESYLAMGYFLETHGWDGLMLLARTLRQGGDWDQAFMDATGATYAGFQREFADYIEGRYNWAAFFGDTILLWIILALVFVLLYLIKRRRASIKLADWERQEAVDDVLYAPFDKPGGTNQPTGSDQG